MADESSKNTEIARAIVRTATDEEQDALRLWAQGLLDLKAQPLSIYQKVRAAVKLTTQSGVLVPIIQRAATELKRVGWDERSWKARLGLGAVVATVPQ